MMESRHKVRRQVLELEVGDESAAWELRSRLGSLQRQRIVPLLDRCFTEVSVPDRLHRIDFLELDLGSVDRENLEQDLMARLEPRLREALAERIREEERWAADGNTDPGITSGLELLELFLRTGTVPWWADAANASLIGRRLGALVGHAPRRLAVAMRRWARDARRLRRLVLHCADEELAPLLRLLVFRRPVGEPESLLRAWPASSGEVSADRFRTALWKGALHTASVKGGSGGPVSFWRQALVEAAMDLEVTYVSLLTDLHRSLGPEGREGPSASGRAGEEVTAIVKLHRELVADELKTDEVVAAWAVDPAVPSSPEAEDESLALGYGDSGGVYVESSGLVLLWPFLGNFFERLGLTADKDFQDEADRQRAVGLLQYLATEDSRPAEYQVPLCKVLCGLDLEEVFEFGPPVTEAEAEECTHLLEAVIVQAPILGSMSAAGLRRTFLARKGVLSARDDAWLLRVERETYDVVLDRLPWSTEWVKQPWMGEPLQVEW